MKQFYTACIALLSSTAMHRITRLVPQPLWEISATACKNPLWYHACGEKLAFHLSDSFYNAIANCDHCFNKFKPRNGSPNVRVQQSQLAMTILRSMNESADQSFMLNSQYEERLKAHSGEPMQMNGLLYRAARVQPILENTYLDLYIYQTPEAWQKIWGRNYMESAGAEAQQDAAEK